MFARLNIRAPLIHLWRIRRVNNNAYSITLYCATNLAAYQKGYGNSRRQLRVHELYNVQQIGISWRLQEKPV